MKKQGMTSNQQNQDHDYLEKFLKETKKDTGQLTSLVKSVLVQFLRNIHFDFHEISEKNGGYLTDHELVNCMVQELRTIIVDLNDLLNQQGTKQ